LLRGLLWPGPNIAKSCSGPMREVAEIGHEIGLHAWDHHAWQVRSDSMSGREIDSEISKALAAFEAVLGERPVCSASAGWKCNELVLQRKEELNMRYHSDCRGSSIFRPIIDGNVGTVQIPVTLPTYDEVIGYNGTNDRNYNSRLLDYIQHDRLNVLTIHAEVEGISKNSLFEEFLDEAEARNIRFCPLGDLLPEMESIPHGRIEQGYVPGRQGRLCVQVQ